MLTNNSEFLFELGQSQTPHKSWRNLIAKESSVKNGNKRVLSTIYQKVQHLCFQDVMKLGYYVNKSNRRIFHRIGCYIRERF